MIKELRMKIALQSMPVLISFVCIFCVMVVAVLSGIMSSTSLRYSKALLSSAFYVENRQIYVDEEAFSKSRVNSGGLLRFEGNYIVYDNNAKILMERNIDEKMKQSLNMLVFEVLQKKSDSIKAVENNDVPYRVLSHIIEDGDSLWVVQIIQNVTEERKILGLFTRAIAVTGTIGIGVMILIGWYFAGKRLQPITEAYLRQNRFIADASHELKTPLTIVQTNVDVMRVRENQTIHENQKWLDNIEVEVAAMRRLIDDMLLLASVERGGLDIEIEEINLSKLVESICLRQAAMAQSRKITLICDGRINNPVIVMADPNRMEQLVKIFIDNAIKYNNPGGSIWVKLRQEHHDVILEFKDDGIGMESEQALHVFERFYRADESRKRESGSIGLGLSVAKEIITAHDGTVQVESEKGRGTVFKILFYKMAVNEEKHDTKGG